MAARARAVVAVACFVQFVDVVGVTLLIVALAAIQRDLGLGAPALSWAAAVYALVFGSLLVLGGRAADLAGRRVIAVPDGPGRGRALGWWTLAGAGVAVASVLTATTGGAAVVGTLFLQEALGVTAGGSGAVFLVFSIAVAAVSTVAPAVLRRAGPSAAMALGLAVVALALAGETFAAAASTIRRRGRGADRFSRPGSVRPPSGG